MTCKSVKQISASNNTDNKTFLTVADNTYILPCCSQFAELYKYFPLMHICTSALGIVLINAQHWIHDYCWIRHSWLSSLASILFKHYVHIYTLITISA